MERKLSQTPRVEWLGGFVATEGTDSPHMEQSEMNAILARFNLLKYEEILRENGFDDWETVTAITEADMVDLELPLGDRRKLQRAIASFSTPASSSSSATKRIEPQQAGRLKRKYRRHPHQDPNAPSRPKTAYVLFGERVRSAPELQGLAFADLAKETGRRWSKLSPAERQEVWEKPAADALQQFKKALKVYEATQEYKDYQEYLLSFYASQHPQQQELSVTPQSSEAGESPRGKTVTASASQLPASESKFEILPFAEEGPLFNAPSPTRSQSDYESPQVTNTDPMQAGMEEVRRIFTSLGVSTRFSRIRPYPPEKYTSAAVRAFLENTGSLLCLWTKQEAENLCHAVYFSDQGPSPQDAAECFAMAAIGSYCDGDALATTYQQTFMDCFVFLLQSQTHLRNLRAMRLFASLAICRFTNSIESARKLMYAALRIGREVFQPPNAISKESSPEADYWWQIYRSVLFLESWFAYNTGHDSRVIEQDITLYTPTSPSTHQLRSIHEYVGELGRLAAYIALDLKDARISNARNARGYLDTLNDWHHTLPPPMQLSRLNLADPRGEGEEGEIYTRRTLLQLHILFLGLFVEPFRVCLLEIGQARLGGSVIPPEDVENLEFVEGQTVLAARQSARVASLLQNNQLVRTHCWVAVYTSFTGCAVLLFSASQRMLVHAGEEVGHDLAYATSHLNLLSLCSYDSAPIRDLYFSMQGIFNDIRDIIVSDSYRRIRHPDQISWQHAASEQARHEFLEEMNQMNEHIRDLSKRIMEMFNKRLRT